MMRTPVESWGRIPRSTARLEPLFWISDSLPLLEETVLPFGLGRSYGDSCLNDGEALLLTRGLRRFITFDAERGLLRAEAGISLDEILRLVVPRGWFLPTTPGTKFVTLGGAIANDVHGKNHHRAGTFGCHVVRFELLRSDGSRRTCSLTEHADWFAATVGGLGLTGLITWAEIRLKKIESAWIGAESVRFRDLDEYFDVVTADVNYEYTVAWVDCAASGAKLGRGLHMRGNHAPGAGDRGLQVHRAPRFSMPIDAPPFLLNRATVRAFNSLYHARQMAPTVRRVQHYDSFFYPLDKIGRWNRIYGAPGFFQYQTVLPHEAAREGLRDMLQRIAASGLGSFLAVLKTFGDCSSPGWLSFPSPGVTLALDFPNRGARTESLLRELDAITRASKGRLYPAKDARMSADDFQAAYPAFKRFSKFIDARFSSSFWRRVTCPGAAFGDASSSAI